MSAKQKSQRQKDLDNLHRLGKRAGENIRTVPATEAFRKNFDAIKWPDRTSHGCAEDCGHPEHKP